jgi:hypothetical protein
MLGHIPVTFSLACAQGGELEKTQRHFKAAFNVFATTRLSGAGARAQILQPSSV